MYDQRVGLLQKKMLNVFRAGYPDISSMKVLIRSFIMTKNGQVS